MVTGGAGFIGSHTSLILLQNGFDVFIVDSLKNSFPESINRVRKLFKKSNPHASNRLYFFKEDMCNLHALEKIFKEIYSSGFVIDGVIHFAGYKSVQESIKNPEIYWINNIKSTLNILNLIKIYKCKKMVFSSSASVYGDNKKIPYFENLVKNPINPYSETKSFIEDVLEKEVSLINPKLKVASLRYFNPIGAHESGELGECSKSGYTNIFPLINKAANNSKFILDLFGNDWLTHDGTCIRDYIHVMDLAEAHINVLDFLNKNDTKILILNIGTGKGTSVLGLINAFEEVNNVKILYRFVSKRIGDVETVFANTDLSHKLLNWKAKRTIKDMCLDGWKWFQKNPDGYY